MGDSDSLLKYMMKNARPSGAGLLTSLPPPRINKVLPCCVCAADILLQGTEEELKGDKICAACYQAGVIWAAKKALEERKGDGGASERTEHAD